MKKKQKTITKTLRLHVCS